MQPKSSNHTYHSEVTPSSSGSISEKLETANHETSAAPAVKDEKIPNFKINLILAKLPEILLAILKQHSGYLKNEENKNNSEEESKNWSEFNLALKKKEARIAIVKNWLEELEKTVTQSERPNGMIELLDSIENLKTSLMAHCLSVLPDESEQFITLEVDEQVCTLWSKLKEVLDWLSSYLKIVNDQEDFRKIETLFIDLIPGLGVRVKLDQQHSFYLMRLLKVKTEYGWSLEFVQNWSSLKKEMQSMGTVADKVKMWIQGSKNYFEMNKRLNEINSFRGELKKEDKNECDKSDSKIDEIGIAKSEGHDEGSYPYFELNEENLETGTSKVKRKEKLNRVINLDSPQRNPMHKEFSKERNLDVPQVPQFEENGKSIQKEQEKESLNNSHECIGFKIRLSDELIKKNVEEKPKMDEIEEQKMALREKVKKNEAHLRNLINAKNFEKKSETLHENKQNASKNIANNKMRIVYENRMKFLHYFRSIMKSQNSVKFEIEIEIAKVLIMAQKLFVKSFLREVIKLAKVNCERYSSNIIGDEFRYYSKENMEPNVYFWGVEAIKEAKIVESKEKMEEKGTLTFGSAGMQTKNEENKLKKFTKLCYPDKLESFFKLKYDEYKKELEELERIKKQLKEPNFSKKIATNLTKYLTDESTKECKEMVILEGGCLSKRLKITANVVTEIILKQYGWMFAAEKCFYRNN